MTLGLSSSEPPTASSASVAALQASRHLAAPAVHQGRVLFSRDSPDGSAGSNGSGGPHPETQKHDTSSSSAQSPAGGVGFHGSGPPGDESQVDPSDVPVKRVSAYASWASGESDGGTDSAAARVVHGTRRSADKAAQKNPGVSRKAEAGDAMTGLPTYTPHSPVAAESMESSSVMSEHRSTESQETARAPTCVKEPAARRSAAHMNFISSPASPAAAVSETSGYMSAHSMMHTSAGDPIA